MNPLCCFFCCAPICFLHQIQISRKGKIFGNAGDLWCVLFQRIGLFRWFLCRLGSFDCLVGIWFNLFVESLLESRWLFGMFFWWFGDLNEGLSAIKGILLDLKFLSLFFSNLLTNIINTRFPIVKRFLEKSYQEVTLKSIHQLIHSHSSLIHTEIPIRNTAASKKDLKSLMKMDY